MNRLQFTRSFLVYGESPVDRSQTQWHCVSTLLLSLFQHQRQLSLCTLRLDLLAESNTTAAEAPSLVTHTLDNTIYFFSGHSSVLVTVWQAMAVVRALCCLSAWLVIACLNDNDRLDGETLVLFCGEATYALDSRAQHPLHLYACTLWTMEADVELQNSLSERWW